MLYFPNPAISAQENGCFPKILYIFQIRTSKKVLTAHRGPIYQIKASIIPCKTHKK